MYLALNFYLARVRHFSLISARRDRLFHNLGGRSRKNFIPKSICPENPLWINQKIIKVFEKVSSDSTIKLADLQLMVNFEY